MNERWMPAAALLALTAFGMARLRGRSPLHPLTLALVATALVGTFYPLATIWVVPISWRNALDASESVVLATQAQYLAFAAGLVLATLGRGARRPRPAGGDAEAYARFRDPFVCWTLLLAGGLLYALYVHQVGLATLADRDDPAGKYLASRGLGAFALGLDLLILAVLWAEGGRVGGRTRLVLRGVALAVGAWAVLVLSVRTYAMALGIGLAHVLCRRRGVRLGGVRPALVLAMAAGYAAVEGYSIVRGLWRDGLLEAVQLVRARSSTPTFLGQWVGGSELSHPFVTAIEVLRDEEAGALGGQSYADALAILMPLALAPERPESLAQSFAAEYYPEVTARGGGTAFSLVGEAWWNLGSFLGPLAVGWLLGALLAALANRAAWRPDGALARLAPYASYLVVLVHRGSASSLLKQLVPLAAACALPCLAASLAWGALARRPRTEAALGAMTPGSGG